MKRLTGFLLTILILLSIFNNDNVISAGVWGQNSRLYSSHAQVAHKGTTSAHNGYHETKLGCEKQTVSKYIGATGYFWIRQVTYGSKCLTP